MQIAKDREMMMSLFVIKGMCISKCLYAKKVLLKNAFNNNNNTNNNIKRCSCLVIKVK